MINRSADYFSCINFLITISKSFVITFVMVISSFFGSRMVNPSTDLDETTLREIAEQTGGRYFRARNTAELEKISKDEISIFSGILPD